MYQPKHFRESRSDAMAAMVRAAPLATFVVSSDDGLVANHIPFVLEGDTLDGGKLLAHIPRANALSALLRTPLPCLAVFHGPEGYVSPSWYATKAQHGKVVPTWNYSVVHAHGVARLVENGDWLRHQIERLTALQEQDRSTPWAVSDAPSTYTDRLMAALVGIEITVQRVEAKTKASQNQPTENQASVLDAVEREHPNTRFLDMMSSALDDG